MTKEEIKDTLETNYENNREWLINYILCLEIDCDKFKKGLELAQELITNSVSKDRYNDVIRRYNNLVKKYNDIIRKYK